MFGKKKKNENVEEVDSQEEIQATPAKKKKRNEMMSSVLQESVVESVLEEFRANTSCTTNRDGETLYVGMYLDTNEIGGLNKKSRRDEAKGQIIEQITSGRIKTYIPADLLENDAIVFIPDTDTILAMDEFGILTEAPYTVAFVTEDGAVENTDKPVTYSRFVDLLTNGEHVDELLADCGFDFVIADDEPEADEAEDEFVDDASVTSEMAPIPDDEDEFVDEYPVDEPDEFVDAGYDESDMDLDEPDMGYAEEQSVEDEVSEDESEDAFAEDEEEVTDEDFNDVIEMTFYDGDLDLVVSTDKFDAQFMHGNEFIPFNENRGDGWLNQYLNEMSRDENARLRTLHQNNLQTLRNKYVQLLNIHAETIHDELATDNPETSYGKRYANLLAARAEVKSGVEKDVAEQRKQLDDEYNKAVKQYGESARVKAEQDYHNRFSQQHQEAIYGLKQAVESKIEQQYQDSKRELDEARRKSAKERMEYGVVETLKSIADEYADVVEQEHQAYDEASQRIRAYLDENRKDDMAHDKILAEELAQRTKAEKVSQEYTEKLAQQSAEFEAKRQALAAQISQTEARADETVATLKENHKTELDRIRKENADLQQQVNELIQSISEIDAKKNAEYGHRINELQSEKESWVDKCDDILKSHKRTNVVTAALAVVAVVAALAIGTLVGSNMNLSFGTQQASEAAQTSLNEKLDELELQNTELEEKNAELEKKNAELTSAQTPAAETDNSASE